jgi:hypothetical protein
MANDATVVAPAGRKPLLVLTCDAPTLGPAAMTAESA